MNSMAEQIVLDHKEEWDKILKNIDLSGLHYTEKWRKLQAIASEHNMSQSESVNFLSYGIDKARFS